MRTTVVVFLAVVPVLAMHLVAVLSLTGSWTLAVATIAVPCALLLATQQVRARRR